MSTDSSNVTICNGCDRVLGGVAFDSASLTFLNEKTGMIDTLHWCQDYLNEKGKEVKGCLNKYILTGPVKTLVTKHKKAQGI